MNADYALHDASAVFSPALLFYKDLIRRNVARWSSKEAPPSSDEPGPRTDGDAGVPGASTRRA